MEDDGTAFPDDLNVDPENDVLVLPFSSGTTGLSKAVMLSHQAVVSNIQRYSSVLKTTPDDTLIGVLPFSNMYGMTSLVYSAFYSGNTLVTVPKFEPGSFLQTIQDQKVTIVHMVPPIAVCLSKHPLVGDFDLSSIKATFCGAAPLGESVTEELMGRINVPLIQGYGMTEVLHACMDTDPVTKGTVGHLLPNTLCKVVNPETGLILPNVGDPGEICLKGPSLMKGYLKNIEATNNTIKDGWIHTGDIGYVRLDGKVVITDRVKDLIKYKAFQIPPAELEDLLLKHSKVQDAAVIGIPDENAGEVPRAYIVCKPNNQINKLDILSFVQEHVSDFKRLRGGIQFISEIPKSPSGKILRRTLKEQFLKDF